MRKTMMTALAALLVGVPATAQEQPHGAMMQQGSMQECEAIMGGPHPQMLLQHQDTLGLDASQVSQLESLRDEAQQSAMPHMQPAGQAYMEASRLLEGQSPDFNAYESKLREAADHMVLALVGMARVGVGAEEVLRPEQQNTLEELASDQSAMMQEGRAGMANDRNDMSGMHGQMAGMIMSCMSGEYSNH